MPASRRPAGEETPRAEDYLEAVYHLIKEKGYANISDISAALEVTPPTVSIMVKRLASRGYLEHEKYRAMKLTPAGERVAKSVIRRHSVIEEFLTMIGVDMETAFTDTEGIEHHVHPNTLQRLERLADYLRSHPESLAAMRKHIESKSSS